MTAPVLTRPQFETPWSLPGLVGALIAIYMVSQFLRVSVGVIAPDLAAELALSAVEIGLLSSSFFFAFAAAQLPLGVAIDRFGPKACLLACSAIAVLGCVLFAAAATARDLVAARVLLGIGCCSSFMAPLAIYAHRFAPERFGLLTGVHVGIGSIGTLIATAPLAFAAAMIGWRSSFLIVAAVTCVLAAWVAVVVQDTRIRSSGASAGGGGPPGAPAPVATAPETLAASFIGIVSVLRIPSVPRLFLVHLTGYSSFLLVVGLWGGPYLTHVYGYDLKGRGDILFVSAVAQIVASFVWGPMDRLLGSHKIPVLLGAGLTAATLAAIAILGTLSAPMLVLWFIVLGFITAYTPVMIAHGRSLFPPHLLGRGITVMNLGTMGGVFLVQAVSGVVLDLFPTVDGAYPLDAYRLLFGLQAVAVLLSGLFYLGAYDPLRPRRL
jgi:MFS family permease